MSGTKQKTHKKETTTVELLGHPVKCTFEHWCGLPLYTTTEPINLGPGRWINAGMEFAGWCRDKAIENANALIRLAQEKKENGEIILPTFLIFKGKCKVKVS